MISVFVGTFLPKKTNFAIIMSSNLKTIENFLKNIPETLQPRQRSFPLALRALVEYSKFTVKVGFIGLNFAGEQKFISPCSLKKLPGELNW